ncbi:MAG TPA: DUF202 domain-containing protein [Gemmatimonadaceae bacterium]|nr:DUF202 domain-containing protein [Gemmatimonadaceae bacterium]
METTETTHRSSPEEDASTPSIRHYQNAEHLSNERTHLAYMRTAISLVSLGITINRFSLYLMETPAVDQSVRAARLLHNAEQVGAGMVLYGFLLMVLSYHRYQRVDAAIDALDYHPQHRTVGIVTLTAMFMGALSLIWIFLR